jgi:hypothetical protein
MASVSKGCVYVNPVGEANHAVLNFVLMTVTEMENAPMGFASAN